MIFPSQLDQRQLDQHIAELLDDPLISLMIAADKVDRRALAKDLRQFKPQRSLAQSRVGCGAMSQGGFSRALAHAPWRRSASAAVCGARSL